VCYNNITLIEGGFNMNKEYIYLSDKEILVTDEKGHATKRDIESTDIHNLLLLENDLEKINKKIINEEKEIHRYEESKLPLKEKIFLAAMPFIVGTLIPVFIFINKPNFLYIRVTFILVTRII